MPSRNDFLEQAAKVRFLAPKLFEVLNVLGRRVDKLEEYTLSTLPDAGEYEGVIVYVSNGASNKYAVISNGSAWYYLEGTAV